MTHQDKIKRIREIIIKAVPEIVELKFGCEIVDYGVITKVEGIELRLNGGTKYITKGQVKRGVVKIIGRKIGIADVLVALQENEEMKVVSVAHCQWLMDSWNLKDDNLDHQPPSVVNPIFDLLKSDY